MGPFLARSETRLSHRVAEAFLQARPAMSHWSSLQIRGWQLQLADHVLDEAVEAVALLLGRQGLRHRAVIAGEVVLEAWPQSVLDGVARIAAVARYDRA